MQAVGRLHLSAPLSFGVTQLSQLLPGFRERHPRLHLDVDLTDRVVDLAEAGGGIVMQPSFIVSPALERGALVPLLTG